MDFEILPDARQPTYPDNPKFTDMKKMVAARYGSFDKEIAEAVEEDRIPAVVIRLEKEHIALEYYDIPEEIHQKMMDAITDDDWERLYEKWLREDEE